ncbi:MAG TPA: DEAD/DEAH box helicase, partial [Planctomycetaceae bacterium]|nr:DEAD/DEAH box helicase [Planctomycetaceae bacterium]
LYSVAQFVDDRRLGPAFRFFNRHRLVDENGRVLGYQRLDELRETLRPVLLRRTRGDVLKQLPPRSTEIVRIPPTDEQYVLHQNHLRIVSSITSKTYFTEMDLLRLRKALLMCRMAANSTFLVNKEPPGYSTKLARIEELVDELFGEPDRKAVLFSEWTTMLNLIEPILKKRKLDYVRLDGSVPQKKRQQLVGRFQNEPACRLFLTTNAGATGLNLQAADTIINVDLPWNPAILEQRIARAHRMGQKNPVQIYLLVTEQTLEERLLATLSSKNDLSLAVLDAESEVDRVDMISGIEEMRRRLEVLIGAAPEAPVDETQKPTLPVESPPVNPEHRERVAEAGGKLLGAAFEFLGQLVAEQTAPAPSEQIVTDLRDRLSECAEEDTATGQTRLSFTL